VEHRRRIFQSLVSHAKERAMSQSVLQN